VTALRAREPAAVPGALRAWVRLLEVHKAALGAIREELQGEVTLPRFDLLANLDREDGQTLASLSRRMLVTAGNLTGLVDRAERDGLVERRADAADRRATRVCITKRGRKLYGDAASRHASRIEALFGGLTAREVEELVDLLGRLRSDLRARKGSSR
jgi:DNA-binding MarR family transcriptional regulator